MKKIYKSKTADADIETRKDIVTGKTEMFIALREDGRRITVWLTARELKDLRRNLLLAYCD